MSVRPMCPELVNAVPGHCVGLENLGNTCFVSAILQVCVLFMNSNYLSYALYFRHWPPFLVYQHGWLQ